jgi:hypothetical protein
MALNPKVIEWITNMNLALVAKFGAGAPQIDVTDATGFITANIGTIIEEPVAGEPSSGSFHPHAANIFTGAPANANWDSIDLSAQVPVGTKAVQLVGTDFTGTNSWYVRFSDANAGAIYLRGTVPGAGLYNCFGGPVPITSSRLLWRIFQNVNCSLTLDMSGYYT